MRFNILWAGYDSNSESPVVMIEEWPRPLRLSRHLFDMNILTAEGLIALALAEAKKNAACLIQPGRHEKYRACMDRP